MPQACPRILLLDDGELDEVAALLEGLGLDFTRLRGGAIEQSLPPPLELLIATARHTRVVRRGSPRGARPGRPLRIIAVREDSPSMRRMLRRLGFQLLVRLPSHDSIWRLLIERALYRGDERRRDERIAVGSGVGLSKDSDPSAEPRATLLDISNRGCRLHSADALPEDEIVSVTLPASATGDGQQLVLAGRVVRSAACEPRGAETSYTSALLFDASMDARDQSRLAAVINRWSLGPSSERLDLPHAPPIPACPSASIPGLVLDTETDPAVRVQSPVGVCRASTNREGEEGGRPDRERRNHARGRFARSVVASGPEHSRVLLGRDISAGGMRVEARADLRVGERLHLALYGPIRCAPLRVHASVIRDDGPDGGLALRFDDLDQSDAETLEKLVACLPDVESLEQEEAAGLGSVISEILDEDERFG